MTRQATPVVIIIDIIWYYLQNGHGDVVNLYRQDQTLLNTNEYDIWGNPTVKEEADQYTNPFRYSGESWDEGQRLQYLRARWYDPSVGRFITEDTWEGRLNHPDSQNPYIYVVNNSLKYVDPSGHIAIEWSVIFGIAAANGLITFFDDLLDGESLEHAGVSAFASFAGTSVTGTISALTGNLTAGGLVGSGVNEAIMTLYEGGSMFDVDTIANIAIGAATANIRDDNLGLYLDTLINSLLDLVD
ncbi:RHS repeat-associated core domain-containing protein [Paenibacillus ihuae]|uniref:RHS repeat-associated core domain-containing protein n=1 Tax=Paenibacillus ihuae TaxID=1232431 RepID=UPI0009EBFD06|nr:RHS repeat-associated core domain-containing protein [Paenibacillus ihuae]